jgi:hypothetical protein
MSWKSFMMEKLTMLNILFYNYILKTIVIVLFLSQYTLVLAQGSSEADILSEIRNFRDLHGYPANDNDLFAFLSQLDKEKITNELIKEMITEIRKQQRISITKNDILSIIKSKRESVKNFMCQYEVDIENYKSPSVLSSKITNSYLFSFNHGKFSLEDKKENIKRTFDGENLLSLHRSNTVPEVGISALKNRSWFFQPWSPLASAMLLDTKSIDFDHEYYDIVLFLDQPGIIVYEKKEMVDGIECMIIASMSQRLYLDPKRDFTIVKKEHFRQQITRVDGKPILIERFLDTVSHLSSLRDFGNSIWLPSEVLNEYYDKDKNIYCREKIVSPIIEINSQHVEDNFVDNIPNNAIVSDTTRGLVYKYEDHPSIDSLLKETAKSKRVFIYRYISVTAGLLMIIIALALKYRAYLKAKREHENKTEEETK